MFVWGLTGYGMAAEVILRLPSSNDTGIRYQASTVEGSGRGLAEFVQAAESGAVGDPSLRLKNGSVRDDAGSRALRLPHIIDQFTAVLGEQVPGFALVFVVVRDFFLGDTTGTQPYVLGPRLSPWFADDWRPRFLDPLVKARVFGMTP